MSQNSGGPAFPVQSDPLLLDGSTGMTLRDWFAGMALSGLLAPALNVHVPEMAEAAYRMADAMLTARDK